ncbi:uncharacterized protein LOC130668390 [Microplitis mediator]|uniref:uncharacterized protein LOC130668390 n=1 Tax=Microplitis mediator TaxID=375433 RepID=UPI00255663CC|nr:uncharacterized protein LOC130668390 [Microplitis mediator]
MNNLKEIRRYLEENKDINLLCTSCEKSSAKIISICEDCKELLCFNCHYVHKSTLNLKNHVIIFLNNTTVFEFDDTEYKRRLNELESEYEKEKIEIDAMYHKSKNELKERRDKLLRECIEFYKTQKDEMKAIYEEAKMNLIKKIRDVYKDLLDSEHHDLISNVSNNYQKSLSIQVTNLKNSSNNVELSITNDSNNRSLFDELISELYEELKQEENFVFDIAERFTKLSITSSEI